MTEVDIEKGKVYPVHILAEGDGRNSKGMKCEWATVKEDKLFVGSIGKEWTNSKGVNFFVLV